MVYYDVLDEKDKLEETNERLIQFIKAYPKDILTLTAMGNSISNGFSMSEPGRALLDRNLNLIECGKQNGITVNKSHLSRNENNNSLAVIEWIRKNCTEEDCFNWTKEDYIRALKDGNLLLSAKEIEEYFSNGSKENIQDIIFRNNPKEANIIILNLGIDSFLDIITRHGSLTIPSISNAVQRDISGIYAILDLIQNNNREKNSHTQIYLCGGPRLANTDITEILLNKKLRRLSKEFAGVTYIPSFQRQTFYKTKNDMILPDPHYNKAEYYHLLNEIENSIIENYHMRDLIIDIDRKLFSLSNANDIKSARYNKNDALCVIEDSAARYESQNGDYNVFLKEAETFIQSRYPFDFYQLSPDENIANDIKKMQKVKKYRK